MFFNGAVPSVAASTTNPSCLVRLPTHCSTRRRKGKAGTEQQQKLGFGSGIKQELSWSCIQGCGACCKLEKGPSFVPPEEIFRDPADVSLYRSLIGPDGWCIHFEKTTRRCSIYSDRPYFCHVEPSVFKMLYDIDEKRFDKEACGFCRDTIKAIYGGNSHELDKFNCAG